jgi:hypothetical protein
MRRGYFSSAGLLPVSCREDLSNSARSPWMEDRARSAAIPSGEDAPLGSWNSASTHSVSIAIASRSRSSRAQEHPDREAGEREKQGPRTHGERDTPGQACRHGPVRILDGARAGVGGSDAGDGGKLGSRDSTARQDRDGRNGSAQDEERPSPPRHVLKGPYPFEWVRLLALRAVLDAVQEGLAALFALRDHALARFYVRRPAE